MERWKDISGFEGVYKISSNGRLKSFKNSRNGYILKNTNSKGWYLSAVLSSGQIKRSEKIHRLVAEAFIKNPYNLPVVNHKNMNKQDNRVENLEWVSFRENVVHAVINNPAMLIGIKRYNQEIRPKVVIQRTLEGEFVKKYGNAKLAQQETGVCSRNILQVASKDEYKPGKVRKQAGGYVWEFECEGN